MNVIVPILLKVLNMSISASFVVGIVIIIRLLMKKLPKIYSYFLWMIVFIRFLIPFTIESMVSLIPVKQQVIQYYDLTGTNPSLYTGFERIDQTVNNAINSNALPIRQTDGISMQIVMNYIALLWLAVVIVLFTVVMIQYIKLRTKLQTATLVHNYEKDFGIYESDQITSPFLLGFIKPSVYIPNGLSESEIKYVLAHEEVHLNRKDNIVKLICFFAVLLHWFNPLAWISFYMMTKDMEMSCDETVMNKNTEDIRGDYSNTLLSLTLNQKSNPILLAFGENNAKARIKNVLKFKRASLGIGIIALLIVAITAITMLTTNNTSNKERYLGKQSDIVVNDDKNVKMTTEKEMYEINSFDEITISLVNYGEYELIYGEDYQIEKKVNDSWYTLKPAKELAWNDIGYILGVNNGSNNQSQLTHNLTPYKGHITGGTYRIIKSISVQNVEQVNTFYIGAEFEVGRLPEGKQKEPYSKNELMDVLLNNRNPYVGNHVKDLKLVGGLPLPEGMSYERLELQTKEEPYGLTVVLLQTENSTDAPRVLYSNAVLLFASIENVNVCTFLIQNQDNVNKVEYKREDLEKGFGALYSYTESKEKLSELLDMMEQVLSAMEFSPLDVEN